MEQKEELKAKEKKPDIFDRIMSCGFLKKFEPIYRKTRKYYSICFSEHGLPL